MDVAHSKIEQGFLNNCVSENNKSRYEADIQTLHDLGFEPQGTYLNDRDLCIWFDLDLDPKKAFHIAIYFSPRMQYTGYINKNYECIAEYYADTLDELLNQIMQVY